MAGQRKSFTEGKVAEVGESGNPESFRGSAGKPGGITNGAKTKA